MFAQYGNVASVKLITDRETGRPRGFGFVEMEDKDADMAIQSAEWQRHGREKPQGQRGP